MASVSYPVLAAMFFSCILVQVVPFVFLMVNFKKALKTIPLKMPQR